MDVFQPYSAAQFQVDARGEVERLQSEGKTPIFCGGTGLYLRAALDDMHFPKGEVDDERRERYNKLAEDLGPLGIHAAAQFQVDARGEVERLRGEGKTPIFCGGTGLYLRAALDDMHFPKWEVDDVRRERYKKLAEDLGPLGIYAMLEKRDPRSAEIIHPNNVKRVIRALEMCDEGVSYADQAAGFSQHNPFYEHATFALTMDRARLYERIDRR